MTPLISLLTDFGTRDPWVAICKGVILGIAPDARLVDITHEIAPFGITEGALLLAAAVPELPAGVHLAVVDPGVGTSRRGVGIRAARGDILVGPDNGLLMAAVDALGGIVAAHELLDARFRRSSASRTFHGRDVFAPAAAHLAMGAALEEFGPRLDGLQQLALPAPVIRDGVLTTQVLFADHFGNLVLAGDLADLRRAVPSAAMHESISATMSDGAGGRRTRALRLVTTFGEADNGEPILFEDSLGHLSIAVAGGSAHAMLGIGPSARVELRRA